MWNLTYYVCAMITVTTELSVYIHESLCSDKRCRVVYGVYPERSDAYPILIIIITAIVCLDYLLQRGYISLRSMIYNTAGRKRVFLLSYAITVRYIIVLLLCLRISAHFRYFYSTCVGNASETNTKIGNT